MRQKKPDQIRQLTYFHQICKFFFPYQISLPWIPNSNWFLNSFPVSDEQRPTLANGHLGFTVFGDSVYMNGLYNGHEGLSHRARIPNWANINVGAMIESTTTAPSQNESFNSLVTSQTFSLNAKTGIFQRKITFNDNRFKIIHLIYAHRFYNRAIINQVSIYRLNYKGLCT